jgi:VCBS repeat-containing protein
MIRSLRIFVLSAVTLLFAYSSARAQLVTVTIPNVIATVGQEVTVPLNLSGVESGPKIQAFQFQMTMSDANIVFVSGDFTGGLVDAWGSKSCTASNRFCSGFSSSTDAFSTSGVLVNLTFRLDGAVTDGTVTLSGFILNGGSPAHTPDPPVIIVGINNAPSTTGDSYNIDEGGTLTVPEGTGVLSNDSDADSDPITATIASQPSNGTVTLNADGSFVYVHDGSETTSDSFTYTASDGKISSATTTVSITINPVNDPPVAAAKTATTNENTPVDVTLSATDPENSPLTYRATTNPTNGAVLINGAVATYTPANGFDGSDSFMYVANDGTLDSAPVQVSLTVVNVNSAPIGANDTYNGTEDVTLNVTSADGVLANDSDPDNDALSAILVADAAHGTVILAANGAFAYIPDANYNGIDLFTYQASDGSAVSSVTTAVISVAPTGTSQLQIIHAGGAGLPPLVDVYLDSQVQIRNVNVRSATSFMSVNDGSFTLGLAPAQSSGVGDVFASFAVTLDENDVNTAVFSGVGGVAANTSMILTPARLASASGSLVDLKFVHASVGTPGVNIDAISTSQTHDVQFSFISGLGFEGAGSIQNHAPARYLMQVSSGASVLDVFDFDFTADAGTYYTIVLLGQRNAPAGNELLLMAFSGAGATKMPVIVTATEEDSGVPREFVLRGNYPNPFNPTTRIEFDLPRAAEVEIKVLDLLGRTMISVPKQQMGAGQRQGVVIDANELTSGIYIYRIVARSSQDTQVATGTMTLIK